MVRWGEIVLVSDFCLMSVGKCHFFLSFCQPELGCVQVSSFRTKVAIRECVYPTPSLIDLEDLEIILTVLLKLF